MRRSPKPKADAAAISKSVPLTQHPLRPSDPLSACNLCGKGSDPGWGQPLQAWREHDERDQPIVGDAALVFVGTGPDHDRCARAVKAHPRLYARETGRPGHFPQLCGPCVKREGLGCRDQRLRANGGAGLNVTLTGGLPPGMIVCPPPKIVRDAVACEGFRVWL